MQLVNKNYAENAPVSNSFFVFLHIILPSLAKCNEDLENISFVVSEQLPLKMPPKFKDFRCFLELPGRFKLPTSVLPAPANESL